MATSLLDALKNNLNTPNNATARDSSIKAKNALRVKATGKANVPSSGANVVSTSETAATQATQQQLNQLNQQNQIASQELGIQQARQEDLQTQDNADTQQRFDQIQQRLQSQERDILLDLEQNRDTLDTQENQEKLEALGASLALQEKAYVDALEREGQLRRLDDSSSFELELQKSVFADQLDLFKDDIAFREFLSQNERERTAALANLSIEEAIEIAKQNARAAAITGATEAVGSTASAVIASQKDNKDENSGGFFS